MKTVFTAQEIEQIRAILYDWFAGNQRALPWRREYHPYQVWIAEIMGQQTQMDRVVEYFAKWMRLFPTIEDVARAAELDILKVWEGLGYYRRARNIHKAAREIMKKHGGQLPANYQDLLSLPGIGPYTAAAIASIAYECDIPVMDANVERFFSRLVDCPLPVKEKQARQQLEQCARDLLPPGQARIFNQALMEFGALVCRPGMPHCSRCPLASLCRAYHAGTVSARPVRKSRTEKIDIVMACCILRNNDLYYIQQRKPDDVWGGLWEFPGGRLKEGEQPEQAARRELFEETEFTASRLTPLATVVHHYTKYRVTLHGFLSTLADERTVPVLHAAVRYAWVPLANLVDFPFPAGHRKLRSIYLHEIK